MQLRCNSRCFSADYSALKARASIGLELHGVQGVPSSNLGAPTNYNNVLSGWIGNTLASKGLGAHSTRVPVDIPKDAWQFVDVLSTDKFTPNHYVAHATLMPQY